MHKLPEGVMSIITGRFRQTESKEKVEEIERKYFSQIKGAESHTIVNMVELCKLIKEYRYKNNLPDSVTIKIVEHKRMQNFTQKVGHCFIKENSVFVGRVSKVSEDRVTFENYLVVPEETLNLKDNSKCIMYICFMLSPMFMNCPFSNAKNSINTNPLYYIEDPAEKAMEQNNKLDMILSVSRMVDRISCEEALGIARYLRLFSKEEFVTDKILKGKIIEYGMANPKEFFSRIKSGSRLVKTAIESALDNDIISFSNDGFFYNNTNIGRNVEDMVVFLSKSPNLIFQIEEQLKVKDSLMIQMRQLDISKNAVKQPTNTEVINEIENIVIDDNDNLTEEQIFERNQKKAVESQVEKNKTVGKSEDDQFMDDGFEPDPTGNFSFNDN